MPKRKTPPRSTHLSPKAVHDGITPEELRVLTALDGWQTAGVLDPTREQVAATAGYTVGGNFNNVCATLRSKGFVIYPSSNRIRLTPEGIAAYAKERKAQP